MRARLDTRRNNPLWPMTIEKKPTEHKQDCNICKSELYKGDLRIKIELEIGYRRKRTYYFHVHCFLDKLMAMLKAEGYDISEYVAGNLFAS